MAGRVYDKLKTECFKPDMKHTTGVGYYKDGYYFVKAFADAVAEELTGSVHAVPGREKTWYVMRPEMWPGELQGKTAAFMDSGAEYLSLQDLTQEQRDELLAKTAKDVKQIKELIE